MTFIKDAAQVSQEVRRGEVFGTVKLYQLDDPSRPESSAKRILDMTYPTLALRQAMAAIEARIQGRRRQGTFVFAGRRAVLAGDIGPEFDWLRQVPRSRTYALFDQKGCYVRGRYQSSVLDPASDIARGGISLLECLVPVMRVRREK